MTSLPSLPDHINFPVEEERTLAVWKEKDVFRRSLELNKDRPAFTFYDGPPFATGQPHYGHILAGTIKDIVPRWAHMSGRHVERRFGWDTHGLPVEFEIDKALGITGPKDVEKMGIAAYNAECRAIVMRYSKDWEVTMSRLARWVDFENDYKTLYPWFMESVWWAFSELHKKGLVYRGVKVMPYSTKCNTPLSNFEAGQNYKDVVDPAVCIGFELDSIPRRFLVAWTTTPWTLPSNLAIAVHPDLDYAVVKDEAKDRELVVLECRLSELHLPADAPIVERFKGSTLIGLTYKPLFPYFAHLKKPGGPFRVVSGTFVTTDQGTGVVHEAPYFGEIDYQTCLEQGVITKDQDPICPVDPSGLFTSEVTDYAGRYVKDADKAIIKALKANDHCIYAGDVKHSYPFCWRSDTPLLYRAIPSWFIRVETLVEKLLANNAQTYWVPQWVKDGRFGNWLRDARDWAVSRNRYWGTPINLWVSDDGQEVVCVSSIAELEQLSGVRITDLHRESVDHITIPSKTGRGVLRRVPEVFDCWFESGSMPYAQKHYPFENKDSFESNFPADFIAEGIDQTRGWFYTLLVLSTALFDKPPFKNLICNGLILASDGSKMSKRKKNYPDPMEVINSHGADALRLYLINSPAVRGENLRFREEGVKDVLKDVLLPWFNAFRFLIQNVQARQLTRGESILVASAPRSTNVMDRWIESFTNSLVKFVRQEMAEYRLYAVVGPLTRFFESLTNCYIRLNRKRLKGEDDEQDETDQLAALGTLARVLSTIVRLMAPFTPYICEFQWRWLRLLTGAQEESVHFTMLPEHDETAIDSDVERRVAALRSVIELVRVVREKKGVPVKYPLRNLIVINRSEQFLSDVQSLAPYLSSECNLKNLDVSSDRQKYGVTLKAYPNFRVLGARLKGDQKKVADYLRNKITEAELERFLVEQKLVVEGHELTAEDLSVAYAAGESNEASYETNSDSATVVLVDATSDDSLHADGLVRELTNRVQKLRKQGKLVATDTAEVWCRVQPADSVLAEIASSAKEQISKATGTPFHPEPLPADLKHIAHNVSNVKDVSVELWLVTDLQRLKV